MVRTPCRDQKRQVNRFLFEQEGDKRTHHGLAQGHRHVPPLGRAQAVTRLLPNGFPLLPLEEGGLNNTPLSGKLGKRVQKV